MELSAEKEDSHKYFGAAAVTGGLIFSRRVLDRILVPKGILRRRYESSTIDLDALVFPALGGVPRSALTTIDPSFRHEAWIPRLISVLEKGVAKYWRAIK